MSRVFINGEQGAEVEQETDQPRGDADGENGKRSIPGGDDQRAGQRGRGDRSAVLDEVFNRLCAWADWETREHAITTLSE